MAQHIGSGLLELIAQVGGNDGAAGEDGHILEHLLAAVAEAGRLHAADVQGTAQLVDDQGAQGVALHILRHDQQLLAGLDHLLQNGQQLLDVGDLLVGDEDGGVIQNGLHLLGVGDHIGGDIAAVELHALDDLAVGLGGLGLLNGDDAVGGDLFHGLGNQLADGLIAGRDGAHAGDVLGAVDGLGVLLDGGHGGGGGAGDPLLHDHRVGAGSQILQALANNGLGQQGGGSGAVAGHVVGLGGNFLDDLGAHVLKGIGQLDLLGDGHAVIGDEGGAELLVEHDVAALGAQGDLNGIGQGVDAALQGAAGVLAVENLLGHSVLPPNCNMMLGSKRKLTRQRPGCRSGARWCTPRRPP